MLLMSYEEIEEAMKELEAKRKELEKVKISNKMLKERLESRERIKDSANYLAEKCIEELEKENENLKKQNKELGDKNKRLLDCIRKLKEKIKKYLRKSLLNERKIKMYKAHIYATMLNDAMENDAVLKAIELNAYVGNKGYNEMLEEYHRNKSTEIVCQVEGISTTFDRIAESGRINHAAEIYENILDKNKENVKETIDELEKSGMIDLALKII